MEHTFPSIGTLFSKSWQSFKKNALVIYSAMIISVLAFVLFSVLGGLHNSFAMGAVIFLVSAIVNALLSLGMIRIALTGAEGVAHIEQLFAEYRHIVTFFVASVLSSVLILVGFVLLVIPGIILALMFGQYVYAIVDKKAGIIESLRYSARITKGYRWRLFLIGWVMGIVMLLSAIPLGLGLLLTVPLFSFFQAHIYLALRNMYEAEQGNGVNMQNTATETPVMPEAFEPLQ